MSRRTILPPLFPPYTPQVESDAPPEAHAEAYARHFAAWAKRLLLLVSLITVAAGMLTRLGWKAPDTEHRLSAVEDSAAKQSRRLDEVRDLVKANLSISCQIVTAVQPKAPVQPGECKDKSP